LEIVPGSSPHPLGGVNIPTFALHPLASGEKEGERGRGRREKGKVREGKGPPRVGLHPHVPNPEKYPELYHSIR